jgi:hypothetical protein
VGAIVSKRARKTEDADNEPLPLARPLAVVPPPAEKPEPAPLVAIGLGKLKDGRHCAVELHLRGPRVVGGEVLSADKMPFRPGNAWSQAALRRLWFRQEYTVHEAAANTREAQGVPLSALEECTAIAMPQAGRATSVLVFSVHGTTAVEPEVVAQGDRLTCWGEVGRYSNMHLLPRR